eukprot:174962_1
MAEHLEVKLHPLVIMNICDHHTRSCAEGRDDCKEDNPRVIGAMFGVQTGRTVEIVNSFEITYRFNENGEINIKDGLFKDDTDLYKQVYPDHEYLGWYTTASEVTRTDYGLHKTFMESNESPLLLMLNPLLASGSKELPIKVFQSEVHIVHDVPTTELVDVGYTVATEEAERITVDHVVKVVDEESTGSVLSPQFQNMKEAVSMLTERVKILHQYLCDVQSGKTPTDQNLLRAIKTVCNRLPTMNSEKFKHDFLSEYNDALLITYLASLTKGANKMNNLAAKFTTAFEQSNRGRDLF